MPVTFKIAAHEANEVRRYDAGRNNQALDAQRVVSQVWRMRGMQCKEVLQSSYKPNENFVPNSQGFVSTVLEAYNGHHHLIIRPDDIWTCILSQVHLYINAHAEELRSKFVTHKGKKELTVEVTGVHSRCEADFGGVAQAMAALLKENIIDPSLHDWIIPRFSTTTPNDVVVYSIMMMGSLKSYFSYACLMCGIPSITLLGEREDYSSILQRIERLGEFGKEPSFFARLLRPVLKEFCDAFDASANGKVPNQDFWGCICHYETGGSGPSYLGGWIGAFAVWDDMGKWQGGSLEDIEKPLVINKEWRSKFDLARLVMTGLRYPAIDTNAIPGGFCDVDIKLQDGREKLDCKMIAGHVGFVISTKGEHMDTIQPSSEWFMFIKGKTQAEEEYMTETEEQSMTPDRPLTRFGLGFISKGIRWMLRIRGQN